MEYLKQKKLTIQDLSSQYSGKRTIDFIMYSYKDAKSLENVTNRYKGLEKEIVELNLIQESNNFFDEEIRPNIFKREYWRQDAGDFVYSFYDYFVLGYGDFGKVPLDDDKIFTIFNFLTYGLVQKMYKDKKFYFRLKNMRRRFNFL